MTDRRSLLPYIVNVRITIIRNVQWFLEHIEEEKEDSEAERFLLSVEDYCQKIRMNPSKRKKKRIRTRHGSGSSSKIIARR